MQLSFRVPACSLEDTPHAERERIVREFKAKPIPGEPHSQARLAPSKALSSGFARWHRFWKLECLQSSSWQVLLLSVWVGAVGYHLSGQKTIEQHVLRVAISLCRGG